jgi:uncharacterized membrane protein YkoI
VVQKLKKTIMAIAVLGAIAVGASAIANAASNSGTASKSGSTGEHGVQGRPPPNRGFGPSEMLLTDGNADKVKQAALDKVPGATVLRVETDAQGSPYEAHLRKSDGTEVTVKVDNDFKATAVERFGAFGRGPGTEGHRGPRPNETALTDGTADKVRQAALDKVPGATVLRVETDAQGSPYEAHLRKSDGTEVTVKVDKDFKATAVETFGSGPGRMRPGTY